MSVSTEEKSKRWGLFRYSRFNNYHNFFYSGEVFKKTRTHTGGHSRSFAFPHKCPRFLDRYYVILALERRDDKGGQALPPPSPYRCFFSFPDKMNSPEPFLIILHSVHKRGPWIFFWCQGTFLFLLFCLCLLLCRAWLCWPDHPDNYGSNSKQRDPDDSIDYKTEVILNDG